MTEVDWPRLLDNLDEPPLGTVAEALADATDISVSQAYDRVETAIDTDTLIERETGGAFDVVTLAGGTGEAESAEDGTAGEPTDGIDTANEPWTDTPLTETEPDVYPDRWTEQRRWMGAKGKLPFAPWGDRNADLECRHETCPDHDPEEDTEATIAECPACHAHREGTTTAECDHDARFKWGHAGFYRDAATLDMAEADPRLDGRAYIQADESDSLFVDGDSVRCPETGEWHPAYLALLNRLGTTYGDVSTSESGGHAVYEGSLPEGMAQAQFPLDNEPWGANDSPPKFEIYSGKKVCVTTGNHLVDTPREVRPIDEWALRAILEEHDALKDPEPDHDTDRARADLDGYEPTATTREETTEHVRNVLAAVDRLDPDDLPLRSTWTGADGTGWSTWDPSYRSSDSGTSLHYNGKGVYHDHAEDEAFGVLSLFAAEEGLITDPWDRLASTEWWAAVDAARERGASIPEYVGTRGEDVEHTAVLPPAVRDLTAATSGWDWRHVATQDDDDGLTLQEGRDRTTAAIVDAYNRRGARVLIEALPTMGKSYGAIKAAAETDEPITMLTTRGNVEQYAQFREWCDEHGLSHYTLPAFTRDCDTANGEHGAEWKETVRGWYARGATPKEIHKSAEYVLGRPLPCQEHEGQRCPYASAWDFEPGDYDVLIGHYAHAHKQKVTANRTVVFDEFADAYETQLGGRNADGPLQEPVSRWLDTHDAIPYDDYTDLIEHRDDDARRADALLWFEEHGVERDATDVFDDPDAHADAPLAVFTRLTTEDLGNGWEETNLPGGGHGAVNRADGGVHLLTPPPLFDGPPSRRPNGVVALDGTPTKRMWELVLGTHLTHRPILPSDAERAEYVREALNLNLVRTTEYVKPYNSADHVSVRQDAALIEAITDAHGEPPALITTSTAEEEYREAGLLDCVRATRHYGNVLGSNEYDDTRLGAVIGSNHYGDGYIKKWGAYAGESVERNDEKGQALSYGPFGDRVLTHMREHDTLQAAMRFGWDGNGAVVYVHTDTLPPWVPIAGGARVLKTRSEGERADAAALEL